jgi:hypothetical protein
MAGKNTELYFESSKKLEELRAKREPLFQRFANNQTRSILAIEIKLRRSDCGMLSPHSTEKEGRLSPSR